MYMFLSVREEKEKQHDDQLGKSETSANVNPLLKKDLY